MCGGTLEQVLCSHVGHIFRERSPYSWKAGENVLVKNNIRLAEVWMDEYKSIYYERISNNLVSRTISSEPIRVSVIVGLPLGSIPLRAYLIFLSCSCLLRQSVSPVTYSVIPRRISFSSLAFLVPLYLVDSLTSKLYLAHFHCDVLWL